MILLAGKIVQGRVAAATADIACIELGGQDFDSESVGLGQWERSGADFGVDSEQLLSSDCGCNWEEESEVVKFCRIMKKYLSYPQDLN